MKRSHSDAFSDVETKLNSQPESKPELVKSRTQKRQKTIDTWNKQRQVGIKFEDAFETYLQRNNVRYHRGLKLRDAKGEEYAEIDFIVPGAVVETKAGSQNPSKMARKTARQVLRLLGLMPKSLDLYLIFETPRTEQGIAACLEACPEDDRKRVHIITRFEDVKIAPVSVLLPSSMSVWHAHHSRSPWSKQFVPSRHERKWIASADDLRVGKAAFQREMERQKDSKPEPEHPYLTVPTIEAYDCKNKNEIIADVAAGKLGFVEAYLFSGFPGLNQNKYEVGWGWLPHNKHGATFQASIIFFMFPVPMDTGASWSLRKKFEELL